jgi:hypothetical protein
MKSITVHGIDQKMEKLIQERAKSSGTSVNRIMKELLAKALGVDKKSRDHREEFLELFGVWTEADEKEFLEALRDFEAVDPEDWK